MAALIRPAQPETDFVRIAELLTCVEPVPVSVDELVEDESRYVPGKIRRRLVALSEHDYIVGYALAVHYPSQGKGKFHIQIVVDPAFRNRGIGASLYDQALAFVREQGAEVVYCEVQERFPEALRFARHRGFAIHLHEVGAALDLPSLDERRFHGVLEAVEQSGIRISSLAQEGNTLDNQRRLYEINRIAALDNPSSDGTFPSFEVWLKLIPGSADFQPAGQIVAIDTARADGAYIGFSGVSYIAETNIAETLLTGVAQGYRGRGIATALKLHVSRFAVAHGATQIVTRVNSKNRAMLAINAKLGFRVEPGFHELHLSLTSS